ncbi:vegetative cell wall protein gp1 [Agrilus planipennis]|uniref:Vegetative cell wall protein gp1 n=1 Tax=Agrilus planipennis TaxID=224129 RepID=A0A1W4W7P6_AGRPL|nr:vegetative cell wall protein gp1 [Agrilus planipennis]
MKPSIVLSFLSVLLCSVNYVLTQEIIQQPVQTVEQPVQQVQPVQTQDAQQGGPNYQISGTFVLERAQTVAVPVYALPPNGSEPITFDPSMGQQQTEIGTNDQPPITLVIPQTPSLVYPEDSQSSQSAPLGSSNGGQPPITQQLPQTASLVYPNQQLIPIMTLPAALPPTGLTANAANQPPITKQIPSTPSLTYPPPQSAPGLSPAPQVIFLQALPGGPNQYYPTFPRITSLPPVGGPPSQPQITQRIPQTPSLVYPSTGPAPGAPAAMASAPPASMPCRPVPIPGPQLPLPCQMLMQTIAAQSQLGALPIRQQTAPPTSVSCPFSNQQMSSSVLQPTGFVAMPFPSSFPLSYTPPAPQVIDPLGPLGPQGFGDVTPSALFTPSPSGSSPSSSNQIQAFRNYFMQLAQGVANSTPSSSQTAGNMRRR